MIANTDAQRTLHPGLVGEDAARVIAIASARGAIGWKVNGAGGEGGSLTLLSPDREVKDAIERQIPALDARYRVLPVEMSPDGLVVSGAL